MLISLDDLVKKYSIKFNGILHVGAHHCEEIEVYEKYIQRDKILWVEALQEKVNYCKSIYQNLLIEQAVISDKEEIVTFNVSNNGQSSSILEFGLHSTFHPDVHYINNFSTTTKMLKDIICNYNIPYNFVNLDIQGVELKALKSMESYLSSVDYIYTEVNSDYVYKDCSLVTEIDDYLKTFGFVRMETSWCGDFRWGDAFYVKNKICFDIGANIGNWSLANLSLYNKIICVEASYNIYNKLQQNFSNNNSVVCLNYAVCNNNGNDITFFESPVDTLSSLNKEWLTSESSRFHNTPYKEVLCKTITIDNMISQYGIPTLIKIDVEGGEYECLSSLSIKVNELCFEWASEVNNITFKCLDYLLTIGFDKFYIQYEDNYLFRPNDIDYKTIEIVKSELLLCVPKKEWGMIWCK